MRSDLLSPDDLFDIVERASSVDERLGGDFVPVEGTDPAVVQRRLEAWCRALGGGDRDRLERRLAWDGLDLDAARGALGRVRLRERAVLPEWVGLVSETLRAAPLVPVGPTDGAWPEDLAFLDAAEPRPFEEVLVPFVLVARRRLAERTPGLAGLASNGARTTLERTLLETLSYVSRDLLLARFESTNARGQSAWDRLLSLAQDPESRSLYRAFVRRLQAGGLADLLKEYPVLARSLGTLSLLWVEAQAELLDRLQADLPDLEHHFGVEGERFGQVLEVRPSLSDAHRGGRSVVALTFASGRRLVYKPKDLGTEAAYQRLLTWLNEQGAPLPFKVLTVLDRTTHGWSEFVEHLACEDREQGRRFYRRAGMLLCLCYVLEVTDCHYENLIAHGEHPVLVDDETLMHHRAESEIPADDDARSTAFDQLYHSVLRSGLLPQWEVGPDHRSAFSLSGLGEADDQDLPALGPTWTRINTDRMAKEPGVPRRVVRANVPRLDGAPLSLQQHGSDVVDGFRSLYAFLLDHRKAFLTCDPLLALARQQVRYVFRPTGIYVRLLRGLHSAGLMRDGADRSIELEKLGRRHVPPRELVRRPDERSLLWPVFAAERAAMEVYDVPFFTARASSDALVVAPGHEIEGAFDERSFDLVVRIVEGLDREDLERQVAYIEATLYTHLARETAVPRPVGPTDDTPEDSPEEVTDEAFVAAALALAEAIRSDALRACDGSASWIAPQLLVRANRYQLQPLGFDLYSGSTGVALFLAAAERIAPGSGSGEVALAALEPLQNALGRRPDHFAATMGLGGAGGLGSVVYGLVKISSLLDEPALLQHAHRTAALVSDELVARDQVLDVVGGAAGTILALVALHEASPEADVLARAVACGEHLLATMRVTDVGARAWVGDRGLRSTGFSHGTAGIAYSLLRLYEHTQDERLRAAAEEAVGYEHTRYSPEHRTWVDHGELGEPLHLVQWCRGAAGIGLARLAGLGVLDTDVVREDLEAALRATSEHGLRGVDQVCCGNLGRAEVLLSAGRRLLRPELTRAARVTASRVLSGAERRGGFVLDPRLPGRVPAPPGFFQGTAGIGYALLRMVHPDALPSVLAWE